MNGDPEFDVVADEQVEQSVGVEVEEAGARAPAGIRGVAAGGDVREADRAGLGVVAPDFVGPEVQDVEVRVAVVVDVADGHAHSVAAGVEAALVGDVREAEFAGVQFVAVQAVTRDWAAGVSGCGRDARVPGWRQPVTLAEVEVEVAVAVDVEERRAAAHVLGEVELAGHAVVVDEVDPEFGGAVDEARLLILGSERPSYRGHGQGQGHA